MPYGPADTDKLVKFNAHKDHALALIVLFGANDTLPTWRSGGSGYCMEQTIKSVPKETWANKLQLRKKLYSLILNEADSVQEHIRLLAEIFWN